MAESASGLERFIDSEFWALGAFYVDFEQDLVAIGKGGTVTPTASFSRGSKTAFVLKDFYSSQYLCYQPEETYLARRTEFQALAKTWPSVKLAATPTGTADELYRRDFEQLKQAFDEKLQKVVLVSREAYELSNDPATRRQLVKRAFEFGTGSPYGFWSGSYGVVGSSPELLFTLKGNDLSSVALAGTAKLGQEQELLASQKDRHEHELVIRDIAEKLGPVSQEVSQGETGLLEFKNLIHLRTPIRAKLRSEVSLNDLVGRLSPTAALGGYPQQQSLGFLKSTAYHRRYGTRYFGSAFGVTGDVLNQFLVSIRNVQWDDGGFFIESGGGVVPASTLERELAEIHLKRQTIRSHYL